MGDLSIRRHFEVNVNNGSEIRKPKFASAQIETVRTDRIESFFQDAARHVGGIAATKSTRRAMQHIHL